MNKFRKGFTLIELLVVIAIIGILSGIVLASLNSARQKGQDASTKATMSNIRSQAAIIYDSLSSYGIGVNAAANTVTACSAAPTDSLFGTTTVASMVSSINLTGFTASNCMTNVTSAAGQATQNWIMKVELRGSGTGGTFWCIDSNGASKATSTNLVAANGYNC